MPVKVIDEKGRLWGKVNIIDLLVVLLVIAAAVFLIVRRLPGKETGETEESKQNVTYQVLVTRVDPVVYDTVKSSLDGAENQRLQMFSSDTNSFLDAFIVNCEAKPHVEYVATSQGEIKRVESSGDDQRLDLVFTIEGESTNPNTHAVGLQQIRVGIGHTIKTTQFELYGSIISLSIEEEPS